MKWLLALVALFLLSCSCGGLMPTCVEECSEEGQCGRRFYRSGDAMARCYIRDSEDCQHSLACTRDGRCHYEPDLDDDACVALDDLDCRSSQGCEEDGACAVMHHGDCRVESTGCQQSKACTEEGRCEYAISERCVEGPVDCKEACRMEGACEVGPEGFCIATSVEDCESSHFCASEGQCALEEGRCVASEQGCQESTLCEWNGWCSPHRDADWCYDGVGACDAVCWERGDCTFLEGVCQATEGDCDEAVACTVQGRCSVGPGPGALCSARNDADCADSLECAAYGRCSSNGAQCVAEGKRWSPSSSYGCTRDPECETHGRCLTSEDNLCQTPEEVGLPPWTPPPR